MCFIPARTLKNVGNKQNSSCFFQQLPTKCLAGKQDTYLTLSQKEFNDKLQTLADDSISFKSVFFLIFQKNNLIFPL